MRSSDVIASVIAAMLVGCATAPTFNLQDVETATTPKTAVTEINTLRGKRVLWGGIIVNSKNLERSTMLEVLAYPLDDRRRPRVDREPLGRFIAEHAGYLETVDYAPGRELTLTGTLTGTREGKIDESHYTYPAVMPDQLHLWSKASDDAEPRVHFGVGVMFHH